MNSSSGKRKKKGKKIEVLIAQIPPKFKHMNHIAISKFKGSCDMVEDFGLQTSVVARDQDTLILWEIN